MLTATLGWQSVFFVNVPIGAVVLVAIPRLITRDGVRVSGRLDAAGAVTVTAALVAFVGAFSAVEQVGFLHPLPVVLFVAALALGAAFIAIERRSVGASNRSCRCQCSVIRVSRSGTL